MDFPLADWEHFRAPVNAEGDEAWIKFVRIVDMPDGSKRILGYGDMLLGGMPVENVWLHPDRVPGRIRRRDNAWPRISPEQARAMCKRTEPAEPEVDRRIVPAPEIPARAATLEEMPQGSKLVGRPAHAAGFALRVTRARGPRLDQYWKVTEISDSIKIAGQHRDGRWFTAHWITKKGEWSFDFSYVLDPPDSTGHRALRSCNATELKVYISDPQLRSQ